MDLRGSPEHRSDGRGNSRELWRFPFVHFGHQSRPWGFIDVVTGFGSRRWRLAPVSILGCLVLIGALLGIGQRGQPSNQSETSSAVGHDMATTTTGSASTSEASPTTTTSTPMSAPGFFVEPCAAIVGSPPLTSNLDLRPFLLTAAQLQAGAVINGPHQTSTTPAEPETYASVPTTSPAAYENITLHGATTPAGTAVVGLSEVIGDVGSSSFASQWLSMLNADLNGPGCNASGKDVVPLPGTNPPVSATFGTGAQRGRTEFGVTLFAAKGSRLVYLSWGSDVSVNGGGDVPGRLPRLPPRPDKSEVAQVVNTALARIPS
jgi:hypothetical protein